MIRKVLFSGIASMLLVQGAYAENETYTSGERILGIEVGSSLIQADTCYSGINCGLPGLESDHEGRDVEYGLRIGAQENEWRTFLAASYFDSSDDDQQYFKGFIEVDYFISHETDFKPYIGLNLGYISYSSTAVDEGGFLYGGQAGIAYRLNQHIELDLSYRYSFVANDSIDHLEGIMFGFNYLY